MTKVAHHQSLQEPRGVWQAVVGAAREVAGLLPEDGVRSCDPANVYRNVLRTVHSFSILRERPREGRLADFWAEKMQFMMGMYCPAESGETLSMSTRARRFSCALSPFETRLMSASKA